LFSHLDFDRILVGGDSAGGNIAAVLSIMATKAHRNLPFKLKHQLLIYPGLFYRPKTESLIALNGYPGFPRPLVSWVERLYLRESLFLRTNQSLFDHVYVNPLRETDAVLAEMPSTTVIIGKYDPLRDEGYLYASRLKKLNVDVQTFEFNTTHAFLTLPFLAETKAASSAILSNLKKHLV